MGIADRRRPRSAWPIRSAVLVGVLCAAAWTGSMAGAATGPAPVSWSTVSTSSSPPALQGAAAAYDADSGTVVLFGGRTTGGALSGATWLWDGTTWREVPASADQPSSRELAAMAFDPARHQLILFGGEGGGGQLLGDTWAWNGVSWFELATTTRDNPAARSGASLGFDGGRDLILFGGTSAHGALDDDTWQWDGTDWAPRTPVVSPPARAEAAFAPDPITHNLVLFGGAATPASSPTPLDDTWEWVAGNWVAQDLTRFPPARYGATFCYDPALAATVLFGGTGLGGALGDTWRWAGGQWAAATVKGAPEPRSEGAAADDVTGRQLVMFGGVDAQGLATSDTTILSAQAPVALNPSPGTGSTTTTPTTVAVGTRVRPGPPTATTTVPAPADQPVHPGDLVIVNGRGFAPGGRITITFDRRVAAIGTTTASADGSFRATVAVPTNTLPGVHDVAATGPTVSGAPLTEETRVAVAPLAGDGGASVGVKLTMVGVAVAIPGTTWVGLAALSGVRRRRATSG